MNWKNIFSPQKFLPELSSTKLAWQLVVIDAVLLVLAIITATLAFGGFAAFTQVKEQMPAGFLAFAVFAVIAIVVRVTAVRLLATCVVGYGLKQFVPAIKNSSVTMWRMVNMYFYALFYVLLFQLAFEIVTLFLPRSVSGAVFDGFVVFARVFGRYFELIVTALWGYWMYGEIKKVGSEIKK